MIIDGEFPDMPLEQIIESIRNREAFKNVGVLFRCKPKDELITPDRYPDQFLPSELKLQYIVTGRWTMTFLPRLIGANLPLWIPISANGPVRQ